MAVTGQAVNVLKMTAQADAVTGTHIVSYIRWVGATTAGHTLKLTNTAGEILFESEADGANFIDIHPLCRNVLGLILETMQSGTLYIYLQ